MVLANDSIRGNPIRLPRSHYVRQPSARFARPKSVRQPSVRFAVDKEEEESVDLERGCRNNSSNANNVNSYGDEESIDLDSVFRIGSDRLCPCVRLATDGLESHGEKFDDDESLDLFAAIRSHDDASIDRRAARRNKHLRQPSVRFVAGNGDDSIDLEAASGNYRNKNDVDNLLCIDIGHDGMISMNIKLEPVLENCDASSCSSDLDQTETSNTTLDSSERREKALRDSFRGIIYGLLMNGIVQKVVGYLMKAYAFVTKKLKSGEDQDGISQEDLAEELLDTADSGFNPMSQFSQSYSGGFGGGGGGGVVPGPGVIPGPGVVPPGPMPCLPPPGVAEMASAAANSAASASASGSAAAAGGTAAGAASTSSAMAASVASASAATQASIAVVATTVVTAAVSKGLAIPSLPPPPMRGNFTPPICSRGADEKYGYVELEIQALPPVLLEERSWILEELFRDVYNEISGMCLDPLNRVMLEATLQDWDTVWGSANHTDLSVKNMTLPEYIAAVDNSITSTWWRADMSCDGCPGHEPMFTVDEAPNRRLVEHYAHDRKLLQFDMGDFFPLFAASFSINLEPTMAILGDAYANLTSSIKVVAATSRSVDADGGMSDPIIQFGPTTIEAAIGIVEENGGISAAFISDDLDAIKDCLEAPATGGDVAQTEVCQTFLENSANLDMEEIKRCFENHMTYECQALLTEALEAKDGPGATSTPGSDVGTTQKPKMTLIPVIEEEATVKPETPKSEAQETTPPGTSSTGSSDATGGGDPNSQGSISSTSPGSIGVGGATSNASGQSTNEEDPINGGSGGGSDGISVSIGESSSNLVPSSGNSDSTGSSVGDGGAVGQVSDSGSPATTLSDTAPSPDSLLQGDQTSNAPGFNNNAPTTASNGVTVGTTSLVAPTGTTETVSPSGTATTMPPNGATSTAAPGAPAGTLGPTTAKPATARPTTASPATTRPTTAKPATVSPATTRPTTAKPATVSPTTAKPATVRPATARPTTARPATARPTTVGPATARPTSARPATARPTTRKPTPAPIVTVLPVQSDVQTTIAPDPQTQDPTAEVTAEVTDPPPMVVGLFLVNTRTESDTQELVDGDSITALPTLSIRAQIEPPEVDYVEFYIDGSLVISDNSFPYSLANENAEGGFNPVWKLAGSAEMTIEVVPYFSGMAGPPYSIDLATVKPQQEATPEPTIAPSVVRLILVDSASGRDIKEIIDGDFVTSSSTLGIRTETNPSNVDKVVYYIDGAFVHEGSGTYGPVQKLATKSRAMTIEAVPYLNGVSGAPYSVRISTAEARADWGVDILSGEAQSIWFSTGTGPPGAYAPNIKLLVSNVCRFEGGVRRLLGSFFPTPSTVSGIHSEVARSVRPGAGNRVSFKFMEGIMQNADVTFRNSGKTATVSFCVQVGFYSGENLVNFREAKFTYRVNLSTGFEVASYTVGLW